MSHVERVAPRVLLDDEQEARAVVDYRVAGQRLSAHHDVGHIARRTVLPSRTADRHRRQVVRRDDRQDVLDAKSSGSACR